jgi:WD40 repeat protein
MSLNDVVGLLPKSGSSENNQSLEVSSARPGKDGFLRYAWLSEAKLLVSTASGRLLIGTFEQPHVPCWTEIDTSESIRQDLRSYIVLRAMPDLTVIGSASGRLYVAQETGLWELTRLSGKITDILFIAESGKGEDDQDFRRRILVTVLGSTQATIIHFSYLGPDIYMDQSYVPLHMGFVVTSIGVCGDMFVLGSRKGGIAVYRKTADGCHIHQTFRNDCKTKGGDAITSIIPLPPEEGSEHKYVLTTCRDGKYRIYELVSSTTGLSLQLRHETTPPLGPMLEGAYLSITRQGDIDLIIYGFRSTNFVVWNETRQEEIASVPCGGAHRTFDFRWGASDTNIVRFVFSKASAMSIYWQDRPSLEVLKPGGHGREIRAVASKVWTIATGAEDTSIRIWDWPNDNDGVTGLRCRAVLQKHTAGIQALKWTIRGNYLLSSAGAEEFFVWKVTNLESQYKGLAVVCEAVYPFRSPDADLRITDFDTTTLSLYTGDPESGLAVTLIFSNSTIKTYQYTRNGGFVLAAKGRYTGACLTQVSHLTWMHETESLALITASTDGHLAIWKDTELDGNYQIIFKQRLHENSIKSFHSQSHGLKGWQIFSVGDDQSLSILSFKVDFVDPVFENVEAVRVKDAHAAAITGIALLATSDRYYYLATISNDQRLKIWQVGGFSSGSQPVRVCLVIDQYSALADPGGLRLLDTEGHFMVGGVGMEVWTLPRLA